MVGLLGTGLAALKEEYSADLKECQMVVLMEPWMVATTESLTGEMSVQYSAVR
jgi:hypothetical protein